ncbi:MAG: malto-oligosyltrehalose synthase, partial [Actinomycetota bacterium]
MSREVRSTYRIQLHAGFTFDDLAAIAPYLSELGVTHVYCSPYLQATEGSTHGYDVVDHSRVNPELGGDEAWDRFCDEAARLGLGVVIDIVPNHVSIEGGHNRRWLDVLEHGASSSSAEWFDIDWDYLEGKVCAPLLGDTLEACLERGEINLDADGDEPLLRYFEHTLPIAPGTDLDASMDEIVEAQNYWLVEWRRGNRNINYRRFFDINTLAAIQVQRDDVFEHVHGLTAALVHEGKVDGLRIDHIDGLFDPQDYLERLRSLVDVPVWVEKILEPSEGLPDAWPVQGTTGYDFMNLVGGLFVNPDNEHRITSVYQDFTDETASLAEIVHEKKMMILRQVMVADLKRLAREASAAFEKRGWATDEGEMMAALGEVLAAFDVYLTYVRPDGHRNENDRRILTEAFTAARKRAPFVPAAYFDRLEEVLGSDDGSMLLLRLQQTSGPVMAKSYEDTVFYNFNRLVSLNEVGGDPGYFGIETDDFHAAGARRAQRWPRAMLATSTHDTKRSEDVRARISLLSEIPERWSDALARFSKLAERYRSSGMPDRNAEYLLYQVLVGAYPLDADRAVEYMTKAAREAKRYTSWLRIDTSYERALEDFVRGLLSDDDFAAELTDFVEPLIEPGRINSLAQTLIKLTFPGVPDTYQGCE